MVTQAAVSQRSTVVIEVWSDLGCPWCYVGKHRLEAAITQRPDADRFAVRMRSFELNPAAPHEPETIEQAFVRAHGGTPEHLFQAERQIQKIAHDEGIPFSLDRLSANTFDLHRVLQYASDEGLGFDFFSSVQDGYFAGTLNPFESPALVAAAESVGLDGQRVREVLTGSEYAKRVRADRNEGLTLGATGVPFMVLDRKLAAPGAQKVDVYEHLLEQVAGSVGSERVS